MHITAGLLPRDSDKIPSLAMTPVGLQRRRGGPGGQTFKGNLVMKLILRLVLNVRTEHQVEELGRGPQEGRTVCGAEHPRDTPSLASGSSWSLGCRHLQGRSLSLGGALVLREEGLATLMAPRGPAATSDL